MIAAWIIGILASLVFLVLLLNLVKHGLSPVPIPKMSGVLYAIIMIVCFALAGACFPSMF